MDVNSYLVIGGVRHIHAWIAESRSGLAPVNIYLSLGQIDIVGGNVKRAVACALLVSLTIWTFEASLVAATQTIYIRADGSIEPLTAPIERDENLYTFTGNIINQSLVVERDNVTVDGNGFTLQGHLKIRRVDSTYTRITVTNLHVTGGGIILENAHSNVIFNNTITGNIQGILLDFSGRNIIVGNIIVDNKIGIDARDSLRNTFAYNRIEDNRDTGMSFQFSPLSTIFGNNITNNRDGIYMLYEHWDDTIVGNSIADNWVGIRLVYGTSNSTFHHNNFVNNTSHVFLESTPKVWDNGYPTGGNHWSDYNGTDLFSGPHQNESGSDGLGDTPYTIDIDNQDRYPLMVPWRVLMGDLNWDRTVNIYDIVLAIDAYGSETGRFGWNALADVADPWGKINIFDIVLIAGNYGKSL